MWEELKVYKRLPKTEINSTFKLFGKAILSFLEGYSIEQTNSIIKLSREINTLEQSIFIEKNSGTYNLEVKTCIKPTDFYRKHKFTMINSVSMGDIMNNHRRTSYPLTLEWNELAFYIATRIKTEIEVYFQKLNSYQKIIENRKEIEPKNLGLDNKYELLIYAAIRTNKKELLLSYLDKKMDTPVMGISKSEFLKPKTNEINELVFLQNIKSFAINGDFESIEKIIQALDLP
jgi:hypothetical protein